MIIGDDLLETIIIIEQVLVLAVLMAVGFIGGKTKILSENENIAMTTLLTKIAMPALTISAFSIGYTKETLNGMIVVFIWSVIGHMLAALLAKLAFIKYPKQQNLVLRFGNTFSNAGFMGLPFIYAVFGEQALLYGSIYMIPFHIFLWTYGESLLRDSQNQSNPKDFLKNPSIIAIIVGAIIFIINIPLPNVVSQPISMIASLTSPLAMLILGEKISNLKFIELLKDKSIYYSSFIKLVLTPLIMLFVLNFFNIDPLIRNIVVIMQSLPIAILTVVLSQKHDLDVDLASKITVVSHVFSVVTIPLIAIFL